MIGTTSGRGAWPIVNVPRTPCRILSYPLLSRR
jgi:hypothetical protein